MSKTITNAQILELAVQVAQSLQENHIEYQVYGSLAYYLYTQEPIQINDIDIAIQLRSFAFIERALSKMPFTLYLSENSIHANHQVFLGNNQKPFDVSFDSFEKYFQPQGFSINNFTLFEIDDIQIRLMTIPDLIKLYKYSLTQGNVEKFEEYNRKIASLVNHYKNMS